MTLAVAIQLRRWNVANSVRWFVRTVPAAVVLTLVAVIVLVLIWSRTTRRLVVPGALKAYQDGGHDIELWLGTITSPGSSTMKVTYTADLRGADTDLVAQEFTAGLGAATSWMADVASGQTLIVRTWPLRWS